MDINSILAAILLLVLVFTIKKDVETYQAKLNNWSYSQRVFEKIMQGCAKGAITGLAHGGPGSALTGGFVGGVMGGATTVASDMFP